MIELCATGLVCSVGLGAPSACAALRAGIAAFTELPYWDADHDPVVGATVPDLGFDRQFGPRLVAMLALALRDCLSHMPGLSLRDVPVLVALAEPGRPGHESGSGASLIARVQEQVGAKFHPRHSQVIPGGHAAGFQGLRMARELLQAGVVPGCLVCGVDSYINASSLFWLDQNWRLKRARHTDGVIPGEAAAVVFVRHQGSDGPATQAEVIGLGFGREAAPVLSEEPLLGSGLADATRSALAEAGWGFHEVDFRLSDVTGENYGFREHTLAEARLARVVRSIEQPLWHAADSIGDTGAAAGVVQLVMAAAAFAKGYAPGPRAACFTSSVTGERAVAAIRRPAARPG
jgi:3-oxoacyl-[acyl-carrier-protein] synthase-1